MSPETALTNAKTGLIFTRPVPPAANPVPYLIILGLGILRIVGYLGWQLGIAIRKNKFAYLYVAPAAIAMTLLTAIASSALQYLYLLIIKGSFTFVE